MNDTSDGNPKSNSGRFRKGRSGNPRGRPTSPKASEFDVMLNKTVKLTHQGVEREVSVDEAIRQRTFRDALAGKGMAIRQVMKWIVERHEWFQKNAPKPKQTGPLPSMLVAHTPHNADSALKLLNIVTYDPRHADMPEDKRSLLLLPWAVQAAIRRRRGGHRLTDQDRESIHYSTIDPESIRWPRESGR